MIPSLARIDIDFEYPTASQKADFVQLVRELRQGLDQHAAKKRAYRAGLLLVTRFHRNL